MLKVLIAEDDLMIADMAEESLVDSGFEVCGIARTVAEAVALGRRHRPDLAVIDLRLADGGRGTEIAAQLAPLGRLGVLYASANISPVMLSSAEGDACLSPTASPTWCVVWKSSPASSQPERRRRRFPAGSSCCRR
jgi:CheY-like chemotaxis protein